MECSLLLLWSIEKNNMPSFLIPACVTLIGVYQKNAHATFYREERDDILSSWMPIFVLLVAINLMRIVSFHTEISYIIHWS